MTRGTAIPPVRVDFFCIGAGKSGSTWLARCLDEHPQITIARSKEPNFFVRKLSAFGGESNSEFMNDWAWYADQYAHARQGDRLGDFSVNLMHNVDDAPGLIHDLYPDAKIVVVLRDPVQRTYSHFWHEKDHDRVPGVPERFEDALANEQLLFRSRYGAQLEAWRAVFPPDSFFLVFDFDLKADAGRVTRRLFRFLGVDDGFQPPSLNLRINEASKVSWALAPLRNAAGKARRLGIGPLLDFMGTLGLQERIRSMLVRRRDHPPIKPETDALLRREFTGDIVLLEQLFGVDLSAWKCWAANDH